jgi:hypothetical protein
MFSFMIIVIILSNFLRAELFLLNAFWGKLPWFMIMVILEVKKFLI